MSIDNLLKGFNLNTTEGLQQIVKDITGKDIELPITQKELSDLTYNLRGLNKDQIDSAIVFSLVVLNTIAMYIKG